MFEDPIVAEVRAIRDQYAKQFNYDLDAICRDLQEKEKVSGRKLFSPPPRRIASADKESGSASE